MKEKEFRAVMFDPKSPITKFKINLPNASKLHSAKVIPRDDRYFLQICFSYKKKIESWTEYTILIIEPKIIDANSQSFDSSIFKFINSIKVGETIFNVYYKS